MEEDVELKDEDGVDGRGFPGGMGGWVIWVWWVSHRFYGWYVGPGLSLRCQEYSSYNSTVAMVTSSM
jgi:hypothetical protein